MQSRHAAFAILRQIASRDFREVSPRLPKWRKPAPQPFRHIPLRPFHHSTLNYDEQSSTQVPSEELPRNSHAPNTSPPKMKPQVSQSPIPFEKQSYEMTFTCKPCTTRSTHRVSKQAYHFGAVLITCPECKNKHVISDHLGIFTDEAMTIEDLMREKGQLVKKGTLSEDGNLEFWEDGTATSRARQDESEGGSA